MSKYAHTKWLKDTLYSVAYEDFYSSLTSALEESNYVFVEKNNLKKRWANLPNDKNHFTIGEVGFGAGINFLNCCNEWLKMDLDNKRLIYFAAEQSPLRLKDLKRAHKKWQSLDAISKEFLLNYPRLCGGFNFIDLCNGKIQLCLMIDDAEIAFKNLIQSEASGSGGTPSTAVDVWFLDGFAPKQNSSAWSEKLIHQISRLSSNGTTLSSYSAASSVQSRLRSHGFDISLCDGFGAKREMITAKFKAYASSSSTLPSLNWYIQKKSKTKPAQNLFILGGGIAGCTTAVALKKRGFNVSIIDRHGEVGKEASANSRAVIYPKLSTESGSLAEFNLIALKLATNYYRELWANDLGEQCGVLLLPSSNKESEEFSKLQTKHQCNDKFFELVNLKQIQKLSGIKLDIAHGLFFPSLGWLSIPKVCKFITKKYDIPIISKDAKEISLVKRDNSWDVFDQNDAVIVNAKKLIIANSYEAQNLKPTSYLSLKKLRGQVTEFCSNQESEKLKCVICGDGYLTPSINGIHACGATYNHNDLAESINELDHRANFGKLISTDLKFKNLIHNIDSTDISGWVGFRGTTRDYLPFAGPVPNFDEMKEKFSYLRLDAKKASDDIGSYFPNLYVNSGMGSRGLSYAPFCAEIIAAEISNQIPFIPKQIRLDIHPARFIIRDLKKKRI